MANGLLLSLEEYCRQNLLEEKVLIVAAYGAGHELAETLVRNGGRWVNLRPQTVGGLAQMTVGTSLYQEGIRLLTGYMICAVVEDLFLRLKTQQALRYFSRTGASPGLVRVLASAMLDLRNAGLTSDQLSPADFVSPKKGGDLRSLLAAYEVCLVENKYLDPPGLVQRARKALTEGSTQQTDSIYLLPSCLRLAPVERQFVEELAGERLRLVEVGPVYGLPLPDGHEQGSPFSQGMQVERDIQRLPWLYDPAHATPPVGDGSLDIFHAYGLRNEAKEVFRRILAAGTPLDTVTVAYTRDEYVPAFYSLARSADLELTVAEGLPASFTGPGRVLSQLLDWIRGDFSEVVLRRMILSGDVSLETGRVPTSMAASLLRSSAIGWSRHRYGLLGRLAEGLREQAGEIPEDADGAQGERRAGLLRRSEYAQALWQIISECLGFLPGPEDDGLVLCRDFVTGVARVLARLARVRSDLDAAALQGLIEGLTGAGELASFQVRVQEALELIQSIVAEQRVLASGHRPGRLHLTSYANLIWSDRPNTFVVGLTADKFPGSVTQDPVLLDGERREIKAGLTLAEDRPAESLYLLATALASRRGRLTLSYPSFDVTENRACYPSPVLLQVYRLLQGDPSLDYTDLVRWLGQPAGYSPDDRGAVLDELEWWASLVFGSGLAEGELAVRGCYPNLAKGYVAREARESDGVTEWDGLVLDAVGEFDPRRNTGLVMSCSRIESLAMCPFAYFLRYILKVEPPEETAYNSDRWLDAMQRGELLHSLFCRFMQETVDRRERPSLVKHGDVLRDMAQDLLNDYRRRIIPPGEVVFQQEAADILLCCDVFLAGEEDSDRGTPILFEVPFGTEDSEPVTGQTEPVVVDLGDGRSFNLRGRIDRIDSLGDALYEVWDYKTGSTWGYEEGNLRGGRRIQHALYAMVAEHVLKKCRPGETPRVDRSGYYFPTVKGEGLRVLFSQADRKPVLKALGHLFDILAQGAFVAASDGAMCGFCDYAAVCDAGAVAKAGKLVQEGDPHLVSWRELRGVE